MLDGLDDILELNSTANIRLFLNLETILQVGITVGSSLLSVNQILVADLSGDGYPDVIALDRTNEKILAWAWNNASTSFDLWSVLETAMRSHNSAVAFYLILYRSLTLIPTGC